MSALWLGQWAFGYDPTPAEVEPADWSLTGIVCVTLAAHDEPILNVAAESCAPERWDIPAHALDFDDLHLPSTTHVGAVCVPVALATGSGAHGYPVGAGVMACLGTALGNEHYARGWYNTVSDVCWSPGNASWFNRKPAIQQELDPKFGPRLYETAVTRADIAWESSARLLQSLWDGDLAVTSANKDGGLAWTN